MKTSREKSNRLTFERGSLTLVAAVLRRLIFSACDHHHSKDMLFLHRCYEQLFFSVPKKYIFSRSNLKMLKFPGNLQFASIFYSKSHVIYYRKSKQIGDSPEISTSSSSISKKYIFLELKKKVVHSIDAEKAYLSNGDGHRR